MIKFIKNIFNRKEKPISHWLNYEQNNHKHDDAIFNALVKKGIIENKIIDSVRYFRIKQSYFEILDKKFKKDGLNK